MSQRKLEADERVTPFPGGDGKALRKWLQDARIIVGPWSLLPSENVCDDLVSVMEWVRAWIEQYNGLTHYEKAAAPALKKLATILPAWRQALERRLSSVDDGIKIIYPGNNYIRGRLGKQRELVLLLEFAVRSASELYIEHLLSIPRMDGWHDYVDSLAHSFEQAMLSANKGIGLKSHHGPMAKFLQGAISYISGEHAERPAIMAYLADKRGRTPGGLKVRE